MQTFDTANPESLSEAATLKLITPQSNEHLQQFHRIGRRIFKRGVLSPMSRNLARKLTRRNGENVLSYYYPILSAGILTCVTNTGQLRHLELPTRTIFDLLD
jgi:hypothetical protein